MEINGSLKKNLTAISIVVTLILLLYSVTSLEVNRDSECDDALVEIDNVCYDKNRDAFHNFHPTVDIKVKNQHADVNGFKIRIYGEFGMEPAVMFRTIRKSEIATIAVAYDKQVMGNIERVEIEPLLNINQEIKYCNLKHGSVYVVPVSEC